MNKTEMVQAMAKKADITVAEAKKCLDALLDTWTETLIKKEDIAITGFGSFKVKTRAKRNGVNPATKEKIVIPATNVVSFKVGKALKEAVKKGK